MTVAFDVGPLGPRPAGVGVYASSLATALAAMDSPIGFAVIGRRPDAVLDLEDTRVATRKAGPYLAWVQTQAMADAKRVNAQLTHFSDGVVPLRRRLPVILAVHDMSVVTMPRAHPRRRWARLPLVMLSPRLARRVIVPSIATADEVMRVCGVSSRRIVVSPYASHRQLGPASPDEIDRVTRRHALAPGSFVLAVGTVEPRKNHLRLIKAFEVAVKMHAIPDSVELAIAGNLGWKFSDVLGAIEESPVRDRIRVLGFVDDEDLAGLMSGAMCVAYVSIYEGFGLPIVEALACGASTLISNVSSMPEVGGDAALYVDPFDIQSIAAGLGRAFEIGQDPGPTMERSLKQAAKFSWRRAASEVMDTYATALSGSE